MMDFLTNNISTIIICILILGMVVLAIRTIIKDRKNGNSCSCGGSCSGCAGGAVCHQKEK